MEGIMAIAMVILVVCIMVVISRWIFRINDIVDRLDLIAKALRPYEKA